jgi:hypothetical protein
VESPHAPIAAAKATTMTGKILRPRKKVIVAKESNELRATWAKASLARSRAKLYDSEPAVLSPTSRP